MYLEDDFMETGSLVYLGNNWYKDTVTNEKQYMTEDGYLVSEQEYERMDGDTFYDDEEFE